MGFYKAEVQYSEIDELWHVKMYYTYYLLFTKVVHHSFSNRDDCYHYIMKERCYMAIDFKDNEVEVEVIEDSVEKKDN